MIDGKLCVRFLEQGGVSDPGVEDPSRWVPVSVGLGLFGARAFTIGLGDNPVSE